MKNLLKEVGFPELPPKPRTKGMTVLSEPGESLYLLSNAVTEDYLTLMSPFIDAVKLRHSICATFPIEWVMTKIKTYQKHGIFIYPGGIVSEVAAKQGKMEEFYKASKELGFDGVELSENMMPPTDRLDWIKHAKSFGLEVVYEYGQKYPEKPLEAKTAIEDIQEIMKTGVKYVVYERAEIDLYKKFECPEIFKEIVEGIGHDNFVLEAGPNKFPEYPVWMIELFGLDVSLANIKPDEAYRLQEYKMGLDRQVGYNFFDVSP